MRSALDRERLTGVRRPRGGRCDSRAGATTTSSVPAHRLSRSAAPVYGNGSSGYCISAERMELWLRESARETFVSPIPCR
jgi:hypothetical protein